MKTFFYLFIMAAVTYLIRVLPFTLCRNKVKSPFLQYFFAYIPYAVLAAMTIPYMLYDGKNPLCSAIALIVAAILAFCKRSLITVALGACIAAFVTGLLV